MTYVDVNGSVIIGDSSTPCTTIENLYVPGRAISCQIPDFGDRDTPESLLVAVTLNGNTDSSEFTLESPNIIAVDPTFGPVSGGISVKVTGSNLAIGNIENTRVTFNGTDCTIHDVDQ